MKKISMLAVAVMIILCLCACGKKDNGSKPSDKNETDNNSSANFSLEEIAGQLTDDLNYIDRIGGVAIELDGSYRTEIDGKNYIEVFDTKFRSTEDIRKFMDDTLTDNLKKTRYMSILDGDDPLYRDYEGKLIVREEGRACGFPFTKDAVIKEKTNTQMTIEREYEDFGMASVLEVKAVLEDGKWKADSVNSVLVQAIE